MSKLAGGASAAVGARAGPDDVHIHHVQLIAGPFAGLGGSQGHGGFQRCRVHGGDSRQHLAVWRFGPPTAAGKAVAMRVDGGVADDALQPAPCVLIRRWILHMGAFSTINWAPASIGPSYESMSKQAVDPSQTF